MAVQIDRRFSITTFFQSVSLPPQKLNKLRWQLDTLKKAVMLKHRSIYTAIKGHFNTFTFSTRDATQSLQYYSLPA